MKQTRLSLTLSTAFLVLGSVLLYQGSNPDFVSKADTVSDFSFDISGLFVIAGIILILFAALIAFIQYLKTTKKEK